MSVIIKVSSDLARIHVFEVHAYFCCHTIPKPQVRSSNLEIGQPNVIIEPYMMVTTRLESIFLLDGVNWSSKVP